MKLKLLIFVIIANSLILPMEQNNGLPLEMQNIIMSYLDSWELHKKVSSFMADETATKCSSYEKTEKGVLNLAFCPISSKTKECPYEWLIATVLDMRKIRIWGYDGLDLQPIGTIDAHGNSITSLVFSHDGKNLASASEDGTVKIWDYFFGRCISPLKGHQGSINSIDYSPDSKYIASGSTDQTVKVWNINDGSIFKQFDNKGWIISVKYHLNGKFVIFSHYYQESKKWSYGIKIWNINNGSFLTIPMDEVKKINLSLDNRFLVCGNCVNKIKIFNLEGDLVKELDDSNNITSLTFTNNNKYIISGGYDKQVKIWDFKTGQNSQTLKDYDDIIFALSLSKDNVYLITGSGDGFIHVWKNQANELLK